MRPLVELHLHLDGSLRLSTMLEIAREEGVRLPATDEAGLRAALACGRVRGSLAQYLEHFEHTTAVMQSRKALTRIAVELIEDCAEDGLKYVEVRYMPRLSTLRGLADEEVVEAILEGLTIGSLRHHVGFGFIVCSLRHVAPEVTGRMIDVAIRYRRNGVVAVDMAGNDALPSLDHAPHFRRARDAGLGVTIHAGESGPPERIHEAIEIFHAGRLGHAIRAAGDAASLYLIETYAVAIEACLTSNVQIGGVAGYAAHPARTYLQEGLSVTLNTDNRMLADTTMDKEVSLAQIHWGLETAQVQRLIRNAIDASFAPDATKTALHAELRATSP